MTFVLDNSIALAWCFEDQQNDGIVGLLDRVAENGAHAPQLWPIEALNGLLTAERRGRITNAVRHRLAGFLLALPIKIDDETAAHVWTDSGRLAEAYKLTANDATYLELALRLNMPLATGDDALIAAAGEAGVPILSAKV